MFADGKKWDIPDKDHLIMFLAEGCFEKGCQINLATVKNFLVHLPNPFRGFNKPFPRGILADAFEDQPYAVFYLFPVYTDTSSSSR